MNHDLTDPAERERLLEMHKRVTSAPHDTFCELCACPSCVTARMRFLDPAFPVALALIGEQQETIAELEAIINAMQEARAGDVTTIDEILEVTDAGGPQ